MEAAMLVRELIDRLKDEDPDALILVSEDEMPYVNDHIVWLILRGCYKLSGIHRNVRRD